MRKRSGSRSELTPAELRLLQSERGDSTSWPAGDPEPFTRPARRTQVRRGSSRPPESAPQLGTESSPAPDNSPRYSVVGQAMVIKGELHAAEDLMIAGRVEGSITHTAEQLVIGRSGVVKASIQSRNLVVEGLVEGDIACRGKVALKETANVTGNIHTVRLDIAAGARFNGSIVMVSQHQVE